MFSTPGRMAGIYRSGDHAQAKAYFAFRSAPLDYDHRDPSVHKRLESDAFRDQTAWRTRELLDSALADPDFYFDACAQVHMASWSAGRVVLVGDAALRPLVAAKQKTGPNPRLMVPRTEAGRRVGNILARLPLLKAASAVDRHVRARNASPLAEYAPA